MNFEKFVLFKKTNFEKFVLFKKTNFSCRASAKQIKEMRRIKINASLLRHTQIRRKKARAIQINLTNISGDQYNLYFSSKSR